MMGDMAPHAFFGRTGIAEGNVHFVRERHEKAPICRELGVTHVVDDRVDVLRHLESVPHRYLFAGGGGSDADCPDWAEPVAAWPDLVSVLRP
jgi:hypothetical protein